MTDEQIISAFENGAAPAEIATDVNRPLPEILAILLGGSERFQALVQTSPKDDKLSVKYTEAEEALLTMIRIMRNTEDDNPGVSAKIARFLYDEFKGRNGSVGAAGGVNILILNERLSNMQKARERVIRTLEED